MQVELITLSPMQLYRITPWNTPWGKPYEEEVTGERSQTPDWYPFSVDLSNPTDFGLNKEYVDYYDYPWVMPDKRTVLNAKLMYSTVKPVTVLDLRPYKSIMRPYNSISFYPTALQMAEETGADGWLIYGEPRDNYIELTLVTPERYVTPEFRLLNTTLFAVEAPSEPSEYPPGIDDRVISEHTLRVSSAVVSQTLEPLM